MRVRVMGAVCIGSGKRDSGRLSNRCVSLVVLVVVVGSSNNGYIHLAWSVLCCSLYIRPEVALHFWRRTVHSLLHRPQTVTEHRSIDRVTSRHSRSSMSPLPRGGSGRTKASPLMSDARSITKAITWRYMVKYYNESRCSVLVWNNDLRERQDGSGKAHRSTKRVSITTSKSE